VAKKILPILLVGAKRKSRYRVPSCPVAPEDGTGVKFFVENKRSLTRETYLSFLFNWGEFNWGPTCFLISVYPEMRYFVQDQGMRKK